VKLEAWAVGITAGSREAPGRKGLWQEISISYNNNNNNTFRRPGSLSEVPCFSVGVRSPARKADFLLHYSVHISRCLDTFKVVADDTNYGFPGSKVAGLKIHIRLSKIPESIQLYLSLLYNVHDVRFMHKNKVTFHNW